MIGEILSTGNEICLGTVVDSNAAHIARELSEIGIALLRHSCVGDDMAQLIDVLKEIAARADILIITGGLGPTVDDLSAAAAAKAAGVDLEVNEAARLSMKQYFAKFSRTVSGSDHKQAVLPVGAVPIVNTCGTAPGFIFTIGKCRCYFLPGVPREMEKMLAASVIPDILRYRGDEKQVTLRKELSLFGLPEARVNDKLKGLQDLFPNVKLGMLAQFPVITVKLTAAGEDAQALDQEIKQAADGCVNILGDKIFSLSGRSMEAEVAAMLTRHKMCIGVAESCTGGFIAHLLTNIAGSSDYFRFSAVTYSNDAKHKLLGVSEATLSTFGAVSEETVKEMAMGVRRISDADWGLATSGIAGPSGGSDAKPVGTLCIGIATADETICRTFHSPFKDRLSNKQIFAICALDVLRKECMMKIKETQ